MMDAVACQLEAKVSVNQLCGIDAPRVPATCILFSKVSADTDQDVIMVCQRVKNALDGKTVLKKMKSTPAASVSLIPAMGQVEEESKSD